MFGSDQMIWPQTIGIGIDTIEHADFLTTEQKRDILSLQQCGALPAVEQAGDRARSCTMRQARWARRADRCAMDDASYEVFEGVAIFRLGGSAGLEQGVSLVGNAIQRAKRSSVSKLLVDITAIASGPPTLAERHRIMTEWAVAGRGAIRLALVIRPEFIDPDNFGTHVALNHGLAFRGFLDEGHAMDWLLGRRGGGSPKSG
jgi:hypothetical protein